VHTPSSRGPVLIIPAAGAGTRLQSNTPKVLSPVNGRPMIDHLFDRYRTTVSRWVLVLHPSFEEQVKEHVTAVTGSLDVAYALQPKATGMLDAILLAQEEAAAANPERIWITWCDQIGVHPATIAALTRMSAEHPSAHVILPTVTQSEPYIHFVRDARGRISAVKQRREGDVMPQTGESDMGLFSLSRDAYFVALPEYGREAGMAESTRERNFLPFFPWLTHHGHSVLTFAANNQLEAVGVNTPDDRRRLEAYLRELEGQ